MSVSRKFVIPPAYIIPVTIVIGTLTTFSSSAVSTLVSTRSGGTSSSKFIVKSAPNGVYVGLPSPLEDCVESQTEPMPLQCVLMRTIVIVCKTLSEGLVEPRMQALEDTVHLDSAHS